jgi:hypothetical protein
MTTTTTQQHKDHGQVKPSESKPRELPSELPVLLRGGGMTFNLPYDEALAKYGLWKVKITKRCSVYGKLLEPDDTAELTGDVVAQLVGMCKATVTDPRLLEEADIISKAEALGLPQKIREIAAFAPSKRDKFNVRLREKEQSD